MEGPVAYAVDQPDVSLGFVTQWFVHWHYSHRFARHKLVLSHSFFLLSLVLVEHLQCNCDILFNIGECMCILDLIRCLQALMKAEME